MWQLLSRKDYVSVAGDLSQASDAKNLLDFMLLLLREHHLVNQDPTVNIDQRARRFMTKVISKIPVIPPSLIMTGVRTQVNCKYIISGGFGRVFRGELTPEGAGAVALKVSYKSDNDIVSQLVVVTKSLLKFTPAGLLSRGVDVEIPEA